MGCVLQDISCTAYVVVSGAMKYKTNITAKVKKAVLISSWIKLEFTHEIQHYPINHKIRDSKYLWRWVSWFMVRTKRPTCLDYIWPWLCYNRIRSPSFKWAEPSAPGLYLFQSLRGQLLNHKRSYPSNHWTLVVRALWISFTNYDDYDNNK